MRITRKLIMKSLGCVSGLESQARSSTHSMYSRQWSRSGFRSKNRSGFWSWTLFELRCGSGSGANK